MLVTALVVMLSQTPVPPLVESTGEVHKNAEPEQRRLRELTIAGGAVAYGAWLVGVIGWFASINCRDVATRAWHVDYRCTSTSPWLWVPQVGPWMALFSGGAQGDWIYGTVGLGIAQLLGLAAVIAGMAIKVPTHENFAMNLTPTANGVALGGTF